MLQKLKRKVISQLAGLGHNRECPICGWTGYCFLPQGREMKVRFDALCPQCGALERHRLAHYVLTHDVKPTNPRTLHVAPEPVVEKKLRQISSEYLSIDLYETAMRQMDITDMDLDDNSYSLIWCSHVLEHIPEDRKAMSELYRVCHPEGFVLLQVPMWRQVSYEDFSITDPRERLKHFYQTDHVRLYGYDFRDRLEDTGFQVTVHRSQDYGPGIVLRHGLQFLSTNEVYICRKH